MKNERVMVYEIYGYSKRMKELKSIRNMRIQRKENRKKVRNMNRGNWV